MKTIFFLLFFIMAGTAFGQTNYGEKITAEGAIPASSLASKMKGNDTLAAKVYGTITEVCKNKGCWMMMDIGGGKTMRVTFKDYAFFVPADISGKTVVLDGYAHHQITSANQLRHYAEDAGKSADEISKITQPEVNLVYEARGMIVK